MENTKLKMIALGDTTKVGCSCYAYIKELANGEKEIIIIDMGIDPTQIVNLGPGKLPKGLPDLEWLQANRKYVKAVFFTHGHMDHMGGVKHYWDFFRDGIPIYASGFTADLIREDLKDPAVLTEEQRLEVDQKVNIIEFDPNDFGEIHAGVFTVTYFPVPHSIPEACGLLINVRDPFQNAVHLADFKFNGLSHHPMRVLTKTLDWISKKAIDYVVIESLYSSNDSGFTPQENLVIGQVFDLIMQQDPKNRVIVSHFARNIARLREMLDNGQYTGRTAFSLLGKAMQDMYALAKRRGNIPQDVYATFDNQNADLILATGSQGEPRSILSKAAKGKNGRKGSLKILPTDVIIFSSDVIPGNEQDFEAMVEDLAARCGMIYVDEKSYLPAFEKLENVIAYPMLHVSGHGTWIDKRRAILLLRPKKGLVPMHGDAKDEEAFFKKAPKEFPHLTVTSLQHGEITFE